jgi:uncharacterized membrane protein (UPF0127 family)
MRSPPLWILLVAACSTGTHAAPPSNLTRIPVTIEAESGTVTIQAEVADTEAVRMRGLMNRSSMADGDGMIFLFPYEQQLSFWMHNTLIPLDMLFIRSDHAILGIVENATPQTDTPRRVDGASQFVLEINGGLSAKQGIKPGQTVSFYAPTPSS